MWRGVVNKLQLISKRFLLFLSRPGQGAAAEVPPQSITLTVITPSNTIAISLHLFAVNMCLSLCDSSWLTVIVPSRSFGKTNCRMSCVSCTHLSEKKVSEKVSNPVIFLTASKNKKIYIWEGWTSKVSYYCSQSLDHDHSFWQIIQLRH